MFHNFFKRKKERRGHPWYENAVIYQIYPWSFKDSNSDGVGDLKGITEKLDYLNNGTENSLQVDAIWLCPIFKSPMKDFGYDISDFYSIDEHFGTMDDLETLLKEAHKRGIKVLLDLVSNHTSSAHPWFEESRSSRNNPKRNWYVWRDPKINGTPPNNWLAVSGGSAWTYDGITKQYYLHNFLKEQPDLNWRNPEVVKEMRKILDFWLKKGIDGFRVDAIAHIIEDFQLRDDPRNIATNKRKELYEGLVHINSTNQPELKIVIDLLCEKMAEYGDKFVVSEAYIGHKEMLEMYEACKDGLLAPFNFTLVNTEWSAKNFKEIIDSFDSLIRPPFVPTYVFGNHDLSRIATRFGKDKARIVAMLLLTLRGTVFLYYGDELGMTDVDIAPQYKKDGFAEVHMPSFGTATNRDPERTPMLWNGTENAGFSKSNDPWLPVSPDFATLNVEAQATDPLSFLNLYRSLTALRKKSSALTYGQYISQDTTSSDIFRYQRKDEKETFTVIINFSNKEVSESIPTGTLEISTHLDVRNKKVSDTINLRPFEGIIIRHN